MIPYYVDDFVTIYHGDCLDLLGDLANIDLVFTSPPYNLGTSPGGGIGPRSGYRWLGKDFRRVSRFAAGYETHQDAMPQDVYDAWQTDVVHACWHTLSDSGALMYQHKPRPWNGILKLPLDYGIDLPLRQIIVWDREVGLNFAPTHFVPKAEWIIVWAQPAWRLASKTASQHGDVWRIRAESGNEHPAAFPVELPARAIASTDAAVVLDPFVGSGTTLLAAKRLGRRAIGIDISEQYCEMAARRVQQDILPFAGTNPTPLALPGLGAVAD